MKKALDRPASPPPRTSVAPTASATPHRLTEEELWARATAGARPVAAGPDVVTPATPRPALAPTRFADLDAVDDRPSLLRGEARFDFAPGDALLEGAVAGLDASVVRRLRRGDYAVEGRLDLHGLTREAAQGAVQRFLRESRLDGKRCVLLVHGRGRHSEGQLPVIKEGLEAWLAARHFGRQVLAFASARPSDGGAGALYVLLRRAGR